MGTTSIIAIDPKSDKSWLKYQSGYPTATIPSLVMYLKLFGYNKFVNEWKRIGAAGGATDFFHLGYESGQGYQKAAEIAQKFGLPPPQHERVSNGLADMLKTQRLAASLRNVPGDHRKLDSAEWGYVIYPDRIDIYHGSDNPLQSVILSKIKNSDLIASIFGDGPEAKIDKVFRLNDKI